MIQMHTALALGFLLLPSVVLLFAYWFVIKTGSASMKEFDYRSPDQIREKYNEALHQKNRFYITSQVLTLISCALIPIGIFIAHLEKQKSDYGFSVELISKDSIRLHADVPKNQEVIFSLNKLKKFQPIRADENGKIKKTLRIESDVFPKEASIEWKDEAKGMIYTITKNLAL